MDDLISRQAAIDALCKQCTVDRPETCSTIQKGDRWCEEVYTLLKLPSAQPEPHWIPCSERLPEDDTEVLVYVFENNRSPYIAWVSDGRWYTEDFEIEREDEPVAWMPLPEPYKAESEDKE